MSLLDIKEVDYFGYPSWYVTRLVVREGGKKNGEAVLSDQASFIGMFSKSFVLLFILF